MDLDTTRASLADSVTASDRLAEEAEAAGNAPYAAANRGFADACRYALRLLGGDAAKAS